MGKLAKRACVTFLLILLSSYPAYAKTVIAQSGNTEITARSNNVKVKAVFLTAKVKPPLPVSQILSGVKTVTIVENLKILVSRP